MKALALCCSNKNNWHMTKGDPDIYKVNEMGNGHRCFSDLDARRRHGDYFPVATRGIAAKTTYNQKKHFSHCPQHKKKRLKKAGQDAVHNKSFYCKLLSRMKTRKSLETEKSSQHDVID